MKKIVKLTEAELNNIIKKIVKEQAEDQYMTDADDQQDKMSGDAQADEGGEPNFEAFVAAAEELMNQGVTIGEMIDQLVDSQGGEETEPEPEVEPAPEQVPAPEQNIAESKKARKR